jgi:excisionase family DNA binding protein
MLSRPFMTTQEVAALLKVREQTVRGWIHGRDLRAVRLGREFRVAARDLEAFVNDHATRAPLPSETGPPPGAGIGSPSGATREAAPGPGPGAAPDWGPDGDPDGAPGSDPAADPGTSAGRP